MPKRLPLTRHSLCMVDETVAKNTQMYTSHLSVPTRTSQAHDLTGPLDINRSRRPSSDYQTLQSIVCAAGAVLPSLPLPSSLPPSLPPSIVCPSQALCVPPPVVHPNKPVRGALRSESAAAVPRPCRACQSLVTAAHTLRTSSAASAKLSQRVAAAIAAAAARSTVSAHLHLLSLLRLLLLLLLLARRRQRLERRLRQRRLLFRQRRRAEDDRRRAHLVDRRQLRERRQRVWEVRRRRGSVRRRTHLKQIRVASIVGDILNVRIFCVAQIVRFCIFVITASSAID